MEAEIRFTMAFVGDVAWLFQKARCGTEIGKRWRRCTGGKSVFPDPVVAGLAAKRSMLAVETMETAKLVSQRRSGSGCILWTPLGR